MQIQTIKIAYYIKEYNFSDFGGDVEALHKAIVSDADPNNQNSLLYKKEAIIGR